LLSNTKKHITALSEKIQKVSSHYIIKSPNLLFLELINLPDQKGDTILKAIWAIIMNLIETNLIIVALCTDHARNE
jgi:hypothetical protein